MNLKPNELALLAAGTLTAEVSLRAADSLAKLLPNIARAAQTIQASYEARQKGCYSPDYASLEQGHRALQTFHSRVAGKLTPHGEGLNLTKIDQQFGDPAAIKDLLAAPLSKEEVAARIDALCKIIDDPKRTVDHAAAKVFAAQLVPDIAQLGGLGFPEAKDRVAEIMSGASPAILFQSPKFPFAPGGGVSPNKPAFFTVTGRDFGRSIAWARKTPNALSTAIRSAVSRVSPREPDRPSAAEFGAGVMKASMRDGAEAAADELRRENGARLREWEGIQAHQNNSGLLSAQLQTRRTPARPVTIAQTAAAAAAAPRHSVA